MNERYGSEEKRLRKIDTYNLWVVPYADFMSVLMVFFLMMFAFAYASKTDRKYSEILLSIEKEMGGTARQEMLDDLAQKTENERILQRIDALAEKPNTGKYVMARSDARQIRIIMNSPVLFDSGSAELKSDTRNVLREVAAILKTMDNVIVVEGHTDSVPPGANAKFRSNWELSAARALAVVNYFVAQEGLSAQRFQVAGYGEYHPLSTNDTAENKSLNRRIEITIVKGRGKGREG